MEQNESLGHSPFSHWCHKHGHQHPGKTRHYWLKIAQLAILLVENKELFIMSQLHVDQTVSLSLQASDAAGNMVKFTPDAPPTWVNSNPAAATDAVAADGLTDVLTPVAGATGQTTTVTVSVVIGGVTFTATIDEAIVAGAIAGVKIVETFSPAAAAIAAAAARKA
jgi:hypothetical protein